MTKTRVCSSSVKLVNSLVNAGIPVVVIRGNHDAANLMTSSLPLPSNPDGSEIMMSADKVDCRVFEQLGIAVHGRSFGQRAEKENMTRQYPSPHSGMFNLGLLHTSLVGGEGHEPYAPCTPEQLTAKEYDYWALGHIHLRGEHGTPDGAPIVFSGNIQGRHIRESGAKGCVIVDVDSRDKTTRTFHTLDVVRWEMCTIDTSAMKHVDEIVDRFQSWLLETLGTIGDRLLVARVRLVGNTRLHGDVHRQCRQIEANLRSIAVTYGEDQAWLEAVRVRTSPESDPITSQELDGPLESVSAVLRELQQSDDLAELVAKELAPLTKKMPADASGDQNSIEIENEQWVQELIESATADLVGRLQGQEVTS